MGLFSITSILNIPPVYAIWFILKWENSCHKSGDWLLFINGPICHKQRRKRWRLEIYKLNLYLFSVHVPSSACMIFDLVVVSLNYHGTLYQGSCSNKIISKLGKTHKTNLLQEFCHWLDVLMYSLVVFLFQDLFLFCSLFFFHRFFFLGLMVLFDFTWRIDLY